MYNSEKEEGRIIMFCEKCGKKVNDDWDFCQNCGNPLNKEYQTEEEKAETSPEETPEKEETENHDTT